MADGLNFEGNPDDDQHELLMTLARHVDKYLARLDGRLYAIRCALMPLLAVPQPSTVVRAIHDMAENIRAEMGPAYREGFDSFIKEFIDAAEGKFTTITRSE